VKTLIVHVPRTAGATLRRIVAERVAPDRLHLDYAESPADPRSPCNAAPAEFAATAAERANVIADRASVVFGHFPIQKYDTWNALRATVLRDPVERAVSQYFFWQRMPRRGHPVHEQMLQSRLSVTEFVQLPHITGFYTESFFPRRSIERFDVVADFARLDVELPRLCAAVGLPAADIPRENANAGPEYETALQTFLSDSRRVAFARDVLAKEIAFYERWAGR